jgi:hypothetical protein
MKNQTLEIALICLFLFLTLLIVSNWKDAPTMEDGLRERVIRTLTWMIADIDYKNELNNQPEDSPQLKEAKEVLQALKESDGE